MRTRRLLAAVLVAALLAGCYRDGYQGRSPAAGHSLVAIDEHRPIEATTPTR